MGQTFEQTVEAERASIEERIQALVALKKSAGGITFDAGVDTGEVMANITLALRHAEDAKMRLGKVFQALNGGVSNNTR